MAKQEPQSTGRQPAAAPAEEDARELQALRARLEAAVAEARAGDFAEGSGEAVVGAHLPVPAASTANSLDAAPTTIYAHHVVI